MAYVFHCGDRSGLQVQSANRYFNSTRESGFNEAFLTLTQDAVVQLTPDDRKSLKSHDDNDQEADNVMQSSCHVHIEA